ncbi:hypothetical protein [Ruminococcus sp.]|uniref:hypothetical protein n=1 Tax=Ruminococcus sp. TaxID=41978 RepID=UPI0025FDBC3F|nr:hypothetical protein [Ruminococcus sp.]MBQ8965924.1 hypothetical protein [Ruminococcus sp.]
MKNLYHYTPMLILTMLASVVMVLVQLLVFCNTMVFDTDYYVWTISDSGSDTALYNELNAYFSQLSKATGVPQEVYTKSLTKESVSVAAKRLAKMSLDYTFGRSNAKPVVQYDYTQFEKDVTDYIEKYSDANNIEKDSEYYSFIDNTIYVAEKKMDATFDIMMTQQLAESSIPSVTRRLVSSLNILMGVGILVLVGLICLMWYVDRHHPFDMPYWIGCILMCGSALLLIPTLYVRFTGYFDGLFMEEESVYYAITGALYGVTNRMILVNSIMFALGFVLLIFTQVIHVFRVKDAKASHDENDE